MLDLATLVWTERPKERRRSDAISGKWSETSVALFRKWKNMTKQKKLISNFKTSLGTLPPILK